MFNKFVFTLFLIINNSVLMCQEFKIDTSYNSEEIVNHYFLSANTEGIKIRNINYHGLKKSIGIFYFQGNYNFLPPFGIVLSSGSAIDAVGPNNCTASNENYYKGDNDLSKIAKSKTFDSAILEFDFMSLTDSINFSFQFASEEYPEYVRKGVSDVFGFFITDSLNIKKNIAVIKKNGIPITVDLINSKSNNDYYIANNRIEYKFKSDDNRDLLFYESERLFQFDGFTIPISTGIQLEPFTSYHFKIAIADAGDRRFDSWIFLKGNSFISNGNSSKPTYENIKSYYNFLTDKRIEIFKKSDDIHIMLPVYFNFNSYEINDESIYLLKPLLDLLLNSNYNLIINGYADEIGSVDYNLWLSQKRSDEVKSYFIKKGVSNERMKSNGKGELKSNKNDLTVRKVEFILN